MCSSDLVGGGAKGVMPESGAAVWTYAVGFSGVASASAWWTGSSAALRLSEPQWAGSGYSCQMLDGDAKKEAERSRCLAPQQDAVDANWAGTCSDVAGFRDSEGRTCDEWADHPSWCIGSPEDGVYDPPSVYRNRGGIDASQACCVCKQSNLPLTGTTWHRDASGHEPAGQTMGEVMLRGNNVMKGYLKNPEATAKAFKGGVFNSGDLAVMHPAEIGRASCRERV